MNKKIKKGFDETIKSFEYINRELAINRIMINFMPLMVWYKDKNYRYLRLSQELSKTLYHKEYKECIGKTDEELIEGFTQHNGLTHWIENDPLNIAEITKKNGKQSYFITIFQAEEEIFTLLITKEPIYNNGEFYGTIGYGIKINNNWKNCILKTHKYKKLNDTHYEIFNLNHIENQI